jgi:hypothetical protein
MNAGKAKALRQLAKNVFLHNKMNKDPNMKAQELGERIYMENTKNQVWKEFPETTTVKEPNPIDPSLPDIEKRVEVMDEDGKPKMKRYLVAMGTIRLHNLCERGIYRRLKKIMKKDPKNFVQNIMKTAKPLPQVEGQAL